MQDSFLQRMSRHDQLTRNFLSRKVIGQIRTYLIVQNSRQRIRGINGLPTLVDQNGHFLRGQHRISVLIPLFIHQQPSSIMIDVGRKVEKRMMLDRKRQQAISSISVNLRIDERSISAGLLIWSKSDRHK